MELEILLIGNVVALLAAAIALGTPRINAGIASRDAERERKLVEFDALAGRVRALSKQIQDELAFPHLPTLRTVAPVHDLLYASPQVNPDPDALNEMLRISQRSRELNFGPRELLFWLFSSAERRQLIRELVDAEGRFVQSYWSGRDEIGSRRSLIANLRGRLARPTSVAATSRAVASAP